MNFKVYIMAMDLEKKEVLMMNFSMVLDPYMKMCLVNVILKISFRGNLGNFYAFLSFKPGLLND